MRRSRKAQSLVEFVISTTIIIPIAVLSIDAFYVLYAIQLNNTTCREAARVASNGDPRLVLARAQQIVDGALKSNDGPISLELVEAGTTVKKTDLDELLPYGGQVSGVVEVATEVTIKPLVFAWLKPGQSTLRLVTRQENPITYVVPNLAENSGFTGSTNMSR